MEKRRIILDCDTGHDDAVAIALAWGLRDRIQIDGLIACAGNQTREKTLENTLNMAEALGMDVPVFAGAGHPVLRERVSAGGIHGESGFDGPVFEKRTRQRSQGNGILWAVNHVLENPGEITYVSVGPWTDLATAILADENFAPSLKEIVLMGGAVDRPGNTTPFAEFNVFADPEAASIVMKSGVPVTMMGLDVTLKVLLTPEILERVKALPSSRYREIFLDSMNFYIPSIVRATGEWPAMHDPCCIAYLADPSIFTFSSRAVSVDTDKGPEYGKTTGAEEDPAQKTRIGTGVDTVRFWDLFFRAMENL